MSKLPDPSNKLKAVLSRTLGRLGDWIVNGIVVVGLYIMTPAYVWAMLVCPFVASHGSWSQVHQVWYDWQSLNVGMLALVSSVIFYRATKYQVDSQRARDFRAAQAFLPGALDELGRYASSCADMLQSEWGAAEARQRSGDIDEPAPADVPALPTTYREVFSQCIRSAEPDAGNFLAKVLSELQVLDARLSGMRRDATQGGRPVVIHLPDTLMSYMLQVGLLRARLDRLFPFARNQEPLNVAPGTWDDLRRAYTSFGWHADQFKHQRLGSLQDFSERSIKRHAHEPF